MVYIMGLIYPDDFAEERIGYAVPAYGPEEVMAALDTLLDGWLAEGPRTRKFEQSLASYVGTTDCVACNSGSSALLLALAASRDPALPDALVEGDEVARSAADLRSRILARYTR